MEGSRFHGRRRPRPTALGRHHRLAHLRASNGLLEGTNSLIHAAKARARGYRTKDKMITIAYLLAGNSHYSPPPTPVPHEL